MNVTVSINAATAEFNNMHSAYDASAEMRERLSWNVSATESLFSTTEGLIGCKSNYTLNFRGSVSIIKAGIFAFRIESSSEAQLRVNDKVVGTVVRPPHPCRCDCMVDVVL